MTSSSVVRGANNYDYIYASKVLRVPNHNILPNSETPSGSFRRIDQQGSIAYNPNTSLTYVSNGETWKQINLVETSSPLQGNGSLSSPITVINGTKNVAGTLHWTGTEWEVKADASQVFSKSTVQSRETKEREIKDREINEREINDNNIVIGGHTLKKDSKTEHNIAIGSQSLTSLSDGVNNIAIGSYALSSALIDNDNTAIGHCASKNALGSSNTSIGCSAFYSGSGYNNVAVGYMALKQAIGSRNIGVGIGSLSKNVGSDNIAIGYNSLVDQTTSNGNISIGNYSCLQGTENKNNTAIGHHTCSNNTIGNNITAIGYGALQGTTPHHTGNYNVAIGFHAGSSGKNNPIGTCNTIIGSNACQNLNQGNNNICIGHNSGRNIENANENICIGSNTKISSEDGKNQIIIGNNVTGVADNQIILGNDTTTSCIINGIVNPIAGAPLYIDGITQEIGAGTPSSIRYKKNIKNMMDMSHVIKKLRPVNFSWKDGLFKSNDGVQYGLIAEEVEKIFPYLVLKDRCGVIRSVAYDRLVPILLSEHKKLYKRVEKLEKKCLEYDKIIAYIPH